MLTRNSDDMKNVVANILKVLLPIALGSGILYWMYRDFDFSRVASTLRDGTNWWLMAFSLVFGITAQVFRGLRWRQTLEPLGEQPRVMNCIHAIFISYTTSLIIPRSGEVTRCGILNRYDGTSFSKAPHSCKCILGKRSHYDGHFHICLHGRLCLRRSLLAYLGYNDHGICRSQVCPC